MSTLKDRAATPAPSQPVFPHFRRQEILNIFTPTQLLARTPLQNNRRCQKIAIDLQQLLHVYDMIVTTYIRGGCLPQIILLKLSYSDYFLQFSFFHFCLCPFNVFVMKKIDIND